ncbi:MAG: DUF1134 domain-containing protein [Gammaproteobacteria bacterium]|jgi:hypothetical protein
MNGLIKRGVGSFMVALLLSASAATAEEKSPSGSVVIDEDQIMWIVGGDIGGGILHYQGEEYKFKTDGLKLGGFGVTKVKLEGDVYDLNDVEDFPGVYGVAEAGAVVAKAGKGDFVMKNDKGVVLHLKAHDKGLALDLGVEGLKITME